MTRISSIDSPLSQDIFDQINRAVQTVGDTARNIGASAQRLQRQATQILDNPLKAAITDLQIRTTVAAPIKFTADELLSEIKAPPNPNSISRFVKPTLEINSPIFGKRVFAPYGAAGADEWESFQNKMWLYGLLGIGGLVGIGIALGYNAARKQR